MGNCLRYRFPNFPISQKTPAHLAQHYLGNWEMITGTHFPISQFPKRHQPRSASTIWESGKLGNGLRYRFPNFPISQKISAHLAQHYLRNWDMITGTHFPISQFPKRHQPRSASTIWESGKLGNGLRYRFPNFPISQKISAHLAQHYLGNLEIGKWLEVQISQFPNFPNNPSPDGPALFGKLGSLNPKLM